MRPLETWMMTYLFNGLWQVPLVYFAGLGMARLTRRFGSQVQHRLWVAVLTLEVLLPACSADLLAPLGELRGLLAGVFPSGSGGGEVRVSYGPASAAGGAPLHLPGAVLGGLMSLYLGMIAFFAICLLWRALKTRGLLVGSEAIALDAVDRERLTAITRVVWPEVAEAPPVGLCAAIASPSTVGFLRPTLLLPTGFLEQVSPADLDAVFAHELAHMARRDFARNVLLEVLSLPIAWHPAAWFTQRQLGETREMACDEMAAQALSGRPAYARSLLRVAAVLFERLENQSKSSHHFHAIGMLDANPLERRIMKLSTSTLRPNRRFVTLAACTLIAVGTCGSALALRMNVGASSAQPSGSHAAGSQESGKEVKIDSSVMAGQVLDKKQPVYPQEAKANPLDGPVVLGAIIGKDGSVEKLTVVKSLRKDYDQSALDAVRNWKYKPYILNGEPTAVETTITVTYSRAI